MPRKVFISFLGTSQYQECQYSYPDGSGEFSESVRFIQEATLDYLVNKDTWTSEDAVYIFLTEASKTNWIDGHTFVTEFVDANGAKHKREDKQEKGLLSRLNDFKRKNGLNFHIEEKLPIILLTKDEEKDMWKIFEKVFSVIKDEDWLYIDVTHGYRYLPMFLLILCNYSKFLKKVKVKSITYGNFEDKKDGVAPIVDLQPLSHLQDWTFAAGDFINNGNASRLISLSREKISPILKETFGQDEDAKLMQGFVKGVESLVSDIYTCRGVKLASDDNNRLYLLKENINKLNESLIAPFNPIVNEINKIINEFDSQPSSKNGFHAAAWCVEHNMYQQAITILEENIVTAICEKHHLPIDDNKRARPLVCDAFSLTIEKLKPSENRQAFRSTFAVDDFELFCSLVNDKIIVDLASDFSKIREIRNDFNHSGMRNEPKPKDAQKMILEIQKIVDKVTEYFKNGV